MQDSKFPFDHVLLVDDNEIDILVNRRLMELTHFASRITVVASGEEALEFFRHECTDAARTPDLVLLEVHLPGMSGYDFLEEYKNLPPFITRKSKVILLSVFPEEELHSEFSNAGIVLERIEKPLTRAALQQLSAKKHATVSASA
jgi:CheY-like chemotaxis protein